MLGIGNAALADVHRHADDGRPALVFKQPAVDFHLDHMAIAVAHRQGVLHVFDMVLIAVADLAAHPCGFFGVQQLGQRTSEQFFLGIAQRAGYLGIDVDQFFILLDVDAHQGLLHQHLIAFFCLAAAALFLALGGDVHGNATHAGQLATLVPKRKADVQQDMGVSVHHQHFFALPGLAAQHHFGVDGRQPCHRAGIVYPAFQARAHHVGGLAAQQGGIAVADLQIASGGILDENHRGAVGHQRSKLIARQIQRNQAGAMGFDQGGNRQPRRLHQPQHAGHIGQHDQGGGRPGRVGKH